MDKVILKVLAAMIVVGFVYVESAKAETPDACTILNPDIFPENSVEFKQTVFSGLEFQRACSILPLEDCPLGLPPQEPLIDLVAQDMLYFNWEIPAANVEALKSELATLGLPPGFQLAPIEIVKGEKPRYYLSLNFYKTPIYTELGELIINYRSEWSTYVTGPNDEKPRYMVFQVHSSEPSPDPTVPQLGFISPAAEVLYDRDGDEIMVSNPGFEAHFTTSPGFSKAFPPNGKAKNKGKRANGVVGKTVLVGQPWAEANDALYWINGVADTARYNGNLTDSPMLSINPNQVRLSNGSPWSSFVPEKPAHVLLFQQPLEFAFTPYFNLLDPPLGLPAWYVTALQGFSNGTFGGISFGHAFLVSLGLAEPLLSFDVNAANVPSIFINFNIPQKKVKALEAELNLPEGLKLVRSRMTGDKPFKYMLTLNIYETPDILTGMPVFRAEWSVYVSDENDQTAKGPYLMVVGVESGGPSLNPVEGFTPPSWVFNYSVNEGEPLIANILGLSGWFNLSFEIPGPSEANVELERDWILANDRVYWRNGVYDRLLYNGLLLDAVVVEVNPGSAVIDDQTIWAQFVDKTPLQIAVFRNPLEFVINPWFNVEELCLPPEVQTQ